LLPEPVLQHVVNGNLNRVHRRFGMNIELGQIHGP
jgi:hypothetical protein